LAFDLICQTASMGLGISQILGLLYPIFVDSRDFVTRHFIIALVTRDRGVTLHLWRLALLPREFAR
jgi:hypothetical protein